MHRPTTQILPILAVLVGLGLGGHAFAQSSAAGGQPDRQPEQQPDTRAEPVRNTAEWNLPKKGEKLAIKGYDPVAYFPEGGEKALKGDKKIVTDYKGVVYRFASTGHRDLFLANPARYEPTYGGWCAWAMLDGDKVEPDPKSFIVKDDRLFLFYDGLLADTRAKWLKTNHDASAESADGAWLKISGEEKRQEPEDPGRGEG